MRAEGIRGISAPTDGGVRIAVALLDLLSLEQQTAARERALAAVGQNETALRTPQAALAGDALLAMFAAVPVDPSMARRVGRSLVQERTLGLWLRYSGIASPEKAYRRSDQMLPREHPDDGYESDHIVGGGARIVFRRPGGAPEEAFCALREGMLQAMPSLFGLPAARVRESACMRRGAQSCVFDVRWTRAPRAGLLIGVATGGLASLVAALAAGWSVVPGMALVLLGATVVGAAGRSFDLSRQLRALSAHQLHAVSLVDEADGALAAKMDELAKIDTILDRSVPEADRTRSRHRRPRTDLAAVVRRASDSVRGGAAAHVQFALDLDEDETTLHGDAFQLEQMVTQLLRNAAQAAAEGPEGRVGVALRRTENGIEIEIADNGPGIDPDLIDRVFDPFVDPQVAGSDTGFGLPVSYRIAQAHGGELRVEGEEGQGTRVTVWLPADAMDTAGGADPR